MDEIIKLQPEELYQYIKKYIKYGFVDKNNCKYYIKDFENINIDELYTLQSPEEIIRNKCAWCWDTVELIRYYMNVNKIYCETYYMEYKDDTLNFHHTHTFIIYNKDQKWYNIEDNSSNNESGIFVYISKE